MARRVQKSARPTWKQQERNPEAPELSGSRRCRRQRARFEPLLTRPWSRCSTSPPEQIRDAVVGARGQLTEPGPARRSLRVEVEMICSTSSRGRRGREPREQARRLALALGPRRTGGRPLVCDLRRWGAGGLISGSFETVEAFWPLPCRDTASAPHEAPVAWAARHAARRNRLGRGPVSRRVARAPGFSAVRAKAHADGAARKRASRERVTKKAMRRLRFQTRGPTPCASGQRSPKPRA